MVRPRALACEAAARDPSRAGVSGRRYRVGGPPCNSSAYVPCTVTCPGDATIAGTGAPAPPGTVMNIVVDSSTGTPWATVLTAIPPVAAASLMHGAGPAAVANGHGDIGTEPAATSATVRTGAPPMVTVGAVVGMIWNVPPCEHWMIALALRMGGIAQPTLRLSRALAKWAA